jgi:FlaA1/EpsC-like NDP-sugar epimerase
MKQEIIDKVISNLTGRESSFFENDLASNSKKLFEEISGKSVLVIGGAGTIGSNYIKSLLHFNPKKLVIVDTNENGLAEIIRDIRSSNYTQLPEIITYPLNFGNPIFERLFLAHKPFDIVANFAAHKHVRSEKDPFSIQAMFENNFIMAQKLLELLKKNPPAHFFCVSTDKATNPVNVMGATKKLMEDVIFSYQNDFKISTARFANVAFSNGSLLESFVNRFAKHQPLVSPEDVKRFFVSPTEAGQLCLLACILGNSGEIFIPKLSPEKDLKPISNALKFYLEELGYALDVCETEEEALNKISNHKYSEKTYPVLLLPSDTSGEKLFEEFFTTDDIVDENRLSALAIIQTFVGKTKDISTMMGEAEELGKTNLSKANLVAFLGKYIDGFSHLETGKNLDQKM